MVYGKDTILIIENLIEKLQYKLIRLDRRFSSNQLKKSPVDVHEKAFDKEKSEKLFK